MKNPLKDLSPTAFVFIISLLVVICAGLVRYKTAKPFDPNVTFEDEAAPEESKKQAAGYKIKPSSLGQNDISARYADRLRDATALTLGISLHVLHERLGNNRVIANTNDLLAEFSKTPLMPPGMVLLEPNIALEYGMIASSHGLYYLRYRPKPLTVEVISVGTRGFQDGAVFMVRLPDAGTRPPEGMDQQNYAGGYAGLYVAPFADAPVPAPFSSPQAYAAAGWRQEPLRTVPFPPEKVAALQKWLAAYSEQN